MSKVSYAHLILSCNVFCQISRIFFANILIASTTGKTTVILVGYYPVTVFF